MHRRSSTSSTSARTCKQRPTWRGSDTTKFRINLSLETPLFNLVGAQLGAMGHEVKSVNGSVVGGFQSISFTPTASTAPNEFQDAGVGRVNGVYRACSDHRKDGEAVGW